MEKDYDVLAISRHISQQQSNLKQDFGRLAESFNTYDLDLGELDTFNDLANYIEKTYGKLDVVVHNAGIAPEKRVDLLDMTEASYDKLMDINLKGPVFLTQKLFPLLDKSDQGSLIFISSISASVASINRGEYCISKAGLSMFASLMATKLSNSSINSFEIRPGIIETDMTKPVLDNYKIKIAYGLVPQGRIGQPEDIAKVVGVLASGDFAYGNGSIIELSGGMQIRSL